eukprot:TRINITY_DN10885_c0_g1_i1.p1 TRINITY_DN10885_c0_g1~~TRINITY_DN10885_c0_g1_i1.p1  ORF type:complete len:282 (-),score=68.84 TRINITY_DN10885_c0_g1_i1:303-1148(-)
MIQLIVNTINLFLEVNLMMNSWNPDLMWHAWIGLGCVGVVYLYHTWRSRVLQSLNEEKPRKFISKNNGIVSQLSLESTWLSMGVSFFCFCVGLVWWHEEYQMVTRHRTEYYVTHGFIAALYAYCIVFQIGFARVIKTNKAWYTWFIIEKSHFRASFLPIVQSTDERINSLAKKKPIKISKKNNGPAEQQQNAMELHRPSVDSILLGRLNRKNRAGANAGGDEIARSSTNTEHFLRQIVGGISKRKESEGRHVSVSFSLTSMRHKTNTPEEDESIQKIAEMV